MCKILFLLINIVFTLSGVAHAQPRDGVVILAAASVKDALDELVARQPGAKAVYASSATQIGRAHV